jgi:hypothetical protein
MLDDGTTLSAAAWAELSSSRNTARTTSVRNTYAKLLGAAWLLQVLRLFMALNGWYECGH